MDETAGDRARLMHLNAENLLRMRSDIRIFKLIILFIRALKNGNKTIKIPYNRQHLVRQKEINAINRRLKAA